MTLTIIRDRWQVTIPVEARAGLGVGEVVLIDKAEDGIRIRPYKSGIKKRVDWKRLRERLELVSAFKGKRGNLSEFVVKDRENH